MSEPARLHKKENVSPLIKYWQNMEAWLNRHALFFLTVCIIVLMILIMFLLYSIIGVFGAGAGMTESNGYYYQLANSI